MLVLLSAFKKHPRVGLSLVDSWLATVSLSSIFAGAWPRCGTTRWRQSKRYSSSEASRSGWRSIEKRARPAYAMVDLSRNTNKAPRDQKLLRRQELHFMYARACMDYLKHAYDPYRGRGANPFEKVPWQDPPRTYLDKLAGKSEPWSAGLKQREERPPHAST